MRIHVPGPHPYFYRTLVIEGRDLDPLDIGFRHTLHPDRLPDPALRCIEQGTEYPLFRELLLASRMRALLRLVRDTKRQLIFLLQCICHIKRERQIAALVTT